MSLRWDDLRNDLMVIATATIIKKRLISKNSGDSVFRCSLSVQELYEEVQR
jgi:hypothetical protein